MSSIVFAPMPPALLKVECDESSLFGVFDIFTQDVIRCLHNVRSNCEDEESHILYVNYLYHNARKPFVCSYLSPWEPTMTLDTKTCCDELMVTLWNWLCFIHRMIATTNTSTKPGIKKLVEYIAKANALTEILRTVENIGIAHVFQSKISLFLEPYHLYATAAAQIEMIQTGPPN